MISLVTDAPQPDSPPPDHALELSASTFTADGTLCNLLNLEHRPQQESMAIAIARSMETDNPILFEAGTGVGKSIAYLVPGIIRAIDQKRQLIVSTHTIALQEQLEKKDIPLCRRILDSTPKTKSYAAFKSTLLVGKSNYLCTTRLANALRDKNELFLTADQSELHRIASWAETSPHGLRHELNPPPDPEVWDLVNADSSACSHKHCAPDKCFYRRAKARVATSNLVIVNHSLLFALININSNSHNPNTRGVLFPNDFLVLDEAHTIPDVATEHFGIRISSYSVNRLLKHLFNPTKKRGILQKHKDPATLQLTLDAIDAATHFFASLHDRHLLQQPVVRIREPNPVEHLLDEPLQKLHAALKKLSDKLEDGPARDELLEQSRRVKTVQLAIREFLTLPEPTKNVHWLERSGRRQNIITLRTAPIDVAPILREVLFERSTSVTCTSATLALANNIEPFQHRIGAEHISARIEHSPFDFERHMRVYVATDIPAPNNKNPFLAQPALNDYIHFCATNAHGGSLVLFTSYQTMRAAAEALAPKFADASRPFFMQGAEHSRTELARLLTNARNGILFGTDSFWTGIDIPGPPLSQVIITRLPFDVPTHPILEARTERVLENGGSPFNEISLPEALIKFRQGVGRLIRTATDTGLITILDSRIAQKPYGRLFLDSLPTQNITPITTASREKTFHPFPH